MAIPIQSITMNSQIVLFGWTALLLSLHSSVDSKKFCESFRENDNSISFFYHPKTQASEKAEVKDTIPVQKNFNVIINGLYWKIFFIYERNPKVAKLHFLNDSESKECPFFSDDYYMSINLHDAYVRMIYNITAYYAILFNVSLKSNVYFVDN